MEKDMTTKQKCKACKIAFLVAFGVSIALIVAGFCVPPQGVIDGSVLKAVGELFAFAALAFGGHAITLGYDLKVQKGDTTVAIDNNKHE
jgi:hypothetical protein